MLTSEGSSSRDRSSECGMHVDDVYSRDIHLADLQNCSKDRVYIAIYLVEKLIIGQQASNAHRSSPVAEIERVAKTLADFQGLPEISHLKYNQHISITLKISAPALITLLSKIPIRNLLSNAICAFIPRPHLSQRFSGQLSLVSCPTCQRLFRSHFPSAMAPLVQTSLISLPSSERPNPRELQ